MALFSILNEVEEPKDFTLSDGSVWRRTGYCCRCGECCIGDPFNGNYGKAKVEGYCPMYRWEVSPTEIGQGIGKCTFRHLDYYKSGCNNFPVDPRQITNIPKCTYKFEYLSGGPPVIEEKRSLLDETYISEQLPTTTYRE